MAKKKSVILYPKDIVGAITEIEVDLSYMFEDDRNLRSIKIDYNGQTFWKAQHHSNGIYYTDNPRDPKILDTTKTPAKCRGSLAFLTGESTNKDGRPKGANNRITVKAACERLGANPAEFLAAVMTGNVGELKRHRVKDPGSVTIAQKIKCAELLLSKLVGNAKPVEVDEDGNNLLSSRGADEEEGKQKVQVYLPQKGASIQIEVSDREAEQISKIKDMGEYIEANYDVSSLDIDDMEDFNE